MFVYPYSKGYRVYLANCTQKINLYGFHLDPSIISELKKPIHKPDTRFVVEDLSRASQ